MAAPGTSCLALIAKKPVFLGTMDAWGVRGDINWKYPLVLWYNSSLNLLLLLLNRTETRGSWVRYDKKTILNLKCPDFNSMSAKQLTESKEIFKQVAHVPLPPLFEQIKDEHPSRVINDMYWLKILGYKKREAKKILEELYAVLLSEIETLSEMMKND